MNINRQHYQTYFLLYVDQELSAADRKAVEDFVRQHQDLAAELQALEDTRLQPDPRIRFDHKKSLLRHFSSSSIIDEQNYESVFILYVDGELSETEKEAVDQFLFQHPRLHRELILLQRACLSAADEEVFEDKHLLYKKSATIRPLVWPWQRVAAAAVLLLLGGWLLFNSTGHPATPGQRVFTKASASDAGRGGKNNFSDAVTLTPGKPLNVQRKKATVSAAVSGKPAKGVAEYNANIDHRLPIVESMDPLKPAGNQPALPLAVLTAGGSPHTDFAAPPTRPLIVEGNQLTDTPIIPQAAQDHGTAGALVSTPENNIGLLASATGRYKMRLVFRRLTRVIKQTARISDDDDKRSVLVGNFQIALK